MIKTGLSLLFFLIPFLPTFSQVYLIKNGSAKFTTSGETFGIDTRFEGWGDGLSGKINLSDSTFTFTFDLVKLQTGIKLRDNHMHEDYLETGLYPKAVFSGKIKPGSKPGDYTAAGEFKLHGITKSVTATGSIQSNHLKASWKLNLTDYKIEVPEKFLIGKISATLNMTADASLIMEKK